MTIEFRAFGIWDKAEEAARLSRFLRLALFAETVEQLDNQNAREVSGLAAASKCLSAIPFENLFSRDCTFFWSALDRYLHQASADDDGGKLVQIGRHLNAQIFDSFFEAMPRGFHVTLSADEDTPTVFPELGIRVEGAYPLTLVKTSDASLVVEGPGKRMEVTIGAVPPHVGLARLAIENTRAQLLLESGSLHATAAYDRSVMSKLPYADGLRFARDLSDALVFLDRLDGAIAARIRSRVRWYIPLRSNQNPNVHMSFSAPKLVGVIFMSKPTANMAAAAFMQFAEVIVHEYAHNELHLLQESDTLFEESPQQFFYSPWRPDPRPLNGLFHGIYSFWHVAEFFRLAEECDALAVHKTSLQTARALVVRQLDVALRQVPSDQLCPRGEEIISAIRKGVVAELVDMGRRAGQASNYIETHIEKWKANNPTYAHVP